MDIYQTNQNSYNQNIDKRMDKSSSMWKRNLRSEFLNQYIHPKLKSKPTLADLGAGTGIDSLFFKNEGLAVTGYDLSEEMVNHLNIIGIPSKQINFLNLKSESNQYDFIWSMNALLHIPNSDIDEVLASIKSIMKKDSYGFIGLYGGENHEGIFEGDHYVPKRFFSLHDDKTMCKIVSKQFEICDFKSIDLIDSNMHFQAFVIRKKSS